MSDATIEIDIPECVPEPLPLQLRFYGLDLDVVAHVSFAAYWRGSDPYTAHSNGTVNVPTGTVEVHSVHFGERELDDVAVEHAQVAVEYRYIDRDALNAALSHRARQEVINTAERELHDMWEHLLGVAI